MNSPRQLTKINKLERELTISGIISILSIIGFQIGDPPISNIPQSVPAKNAFMLI